MKHIHIGQLPVEQSHGDTISIQRIVRVGESQTKLQTINRAWLEPGAAFPPHSHPDCEEYFIMLEGSGKAEIGGETFEITAGDAVVIGINESHSLKNTGPDRLVYLSVRILI